MPPAPCYAPYFHGNYTIKERRPYDGAEILQPQNMGGDGEVDQQGHGVHHGGDKG